jgi:hypothetical protein
MSRRAEREGVQNELFSGPPVTSGSTLLIGWFAWRFWLMRGAQRSPDFRARFLSRETWWHPSARTDYRYYLINAVVVPVALASIRMSSTTVTAWLEQLFGASAARASASAYSILAALARMDFLRKHAEPLAHQSCSPSDPSQRRDAPSRMQPGIRAGRVGPAVRHALRAGRSAGNFSPRPG